FHGFIIPYVIHNCKLGLAGLQPGGVYDYSGPMG
ncbi:unnamed protein product, partial [marine sediment metagenome]